jgi:RNA polymerase sigma-70 factor (ECF subfamily)
MIGVLRADPPPETADFGAGAAEQAAVQQLAIDNLVQATVAGDIVARDRLLAAVYPLLLGYCRGRLGHHTSVIGSADDVAQEVCLAVVTALPSYVISGRSFQAFCLRHRRAQSRRRLPRDGPQPHRCGC